MRDEELKSNIDYNEGQKEAAHRILIELTNLFDQYRDDIRIVGGWIPDLMFPNQNHIGSVDVDVLVNHLKLKDAGYLTMERILRNNGYREHPEKYFSYIKEVVVNNIKYTVDVDILAGIYGGTSIKRRSQHVQGLKALKATGGNFAFEFPAQEIVVEAQRPDGAYDIAHVNVVAVVPYLVMKTAALGRGKAKDAYDIYFIVKHYAGGFKKLAKEFKEVKNDKIILTMVQKLSEKFKSENHAGPCDVVEFNNLTDQEEIELLRRDAYEQIQAFLKMIVNQDDSL